jgi:hypothetical protein
MFASCLIQFQSLFSDFLSLSDGDSPRLARARFKFAGASAPYDRATRVNPVRWAHDALQFPRRATGFRQDVVYFLCTCRPLENMALVFPERNPRALSLESIVVGSPSIRLRFAQQTKQIFVQCGQPQEDRLLLEYVRQSCIAWQKVAQQLPQGHSPR